MGYVIGLDLMHCFIYVFQLLPSRKDLVQGLMKQRTDEANLIQRLMKQIWFKA